MYFFMKSGKQHLDLRGDLVLSHNDALVKTRIKSAAPRFVSNAIYILNIHQLSLIQKLKASKAALSFIWGKNKALTPDTIDIERI